MVSESSACNEGENNEVVIDHLPSLKDEQKSLSIIRGHFEARG